MKIQGLDFKHLLSFIKKRSIAVLLLGTAILFYACKDNEISKIKAFSSPENLPVLEADNFETTSTDSGQVRFNLKAPKLLRYEEGSQTFIEFPKGVEFIKYDAGHKVVSTLTADYAKQFIKEKRWEAKNNVVVTNERGDSLKTEYLIWNEKSQKIQTEEFFKIIRDDRIISGYGLVSDQDMLHWEFKKPKGTIYMKAENKPRPAKAKPNQPQNEQVDKELEFK